MNPKFIFTVCLELGGFTSWLIGPVNLASFGFFLTLDSES